MGRFKHYISLGYFCSVALELERMGLRETSSPFDWLISDFCGVIDAIENHFEHFFDYDFYEQSASTPHCYRNSYYGFDFYHDFDAYKSLKAQFPQFQEKYERRIERFYRNTSEPTLFIRYISDEECDENMKSTELIEIEKNYARVQNVIKCLNKENEIIWIANEGVESSIIDIYHVAKDENDHVARRFLDKMEELRNVFDGMDYPERKDNLKWEKTKNNNSAMNKEQNLMYRIRRHYRLYYHHRKQYIH